MITILFMNKIHKKIKTKPYCSTHANGFIFQDYRYCEIYSQDLKILFT